jgi:hypothetical protein
MVLQKHTTLAKDDGGERKLRGPQAADVKYYKRAKARDQR